MLLRLIISTTIIAGVGQKNCLLEVYSSADITAWNALWVCAYLHNIV